MLEELQWVYELACDPDPLHLRRVRRFVTVCLRRHGQRTIETDCLLVASELASNAVLHARTQFSVSMCGQSRSVLIMVHDGSPSPPKPIPFGPASEAGRGLFIVSQCADDWGVTLDEDEQGKTVWARIERRAPAGGRGRAAAT